MTGGTFNFFRISNTPAQVFNFDTKTLAVSTVYLPTLLRVHTDQDNAGLMKRTATTCSPEDRSNFFQEFRLRILHSGLSADGDRYYRYKCFWLPSGQQTRQSTPILKIGTDENPPTQKEEIHAE